jgi:hypothetical protein
MIPVRPGLIADIKYFGPHKGGSIRDGVILSEQHEAAMRSLVPAAELRSWSCDSDEAIAAFDSYAAG